MFLNFIIKYNIFCIFLISTFYQVKEEFYLLIFGISIEITVAAHATVRNNTGRLYIFCLVFPNGNNLQNFSVI